MAAPEPTGGEFTLPIPTSSQLEHQVCQIRGWLSLTAALTTMKKGAFLGSGCWEAVGGR